MEKFNMMPINRTAENALIAMNEKPDYAAPHCIQLLLVTFSRAEIEIEDDVVETIRAMMNWTPQRIMNFFMIRPDEEYDPAEWKKAVNRHELARVILNDIEEKMVHHFPWYRSMQE